MSENIEGFFQSFRYRQSVMNPGKSVLSHSFADPFGRGQVISISKAVFKNRF